MDLAVSSVFPVASTSDLERAVKSVNRKAARLGRSGIRLFVGETRRATRTRYIQVETTTGTAMRPVTVSMDVVNVRVEGEIPSLGGWTIAARVEAGADKDGREVAILMDADGVSREAREAIVDGGVRCDHCGLDRRRKHAVVVRHEETGEVKVVGTTCIHDFTGGAWGGSLNTLLSFLGGFQEVIELVREREGDGNYPLLSRSEFVEALQAVAWGVHYASREGYVSRSRSEETGHAATADRVRDALIRVGHAPSEDVDKARKIVEWAQAQNPQGDYMLNLCSALQADYIPWNLVGVAASATVAYERALRNAARAQGPKSEAWIGQVGVRGNLGVFLVERTFPFSGMYGDGVGHVFRRESDAALAVWFTGRERAKEGDRVAIQATPKRQQVGRTGERETVISRAKIQPAV